MVAQVSPPQTRRSMAAALLAQTPAGRVGKGADLDGVVIYLASDMSSYHTGGTITIDGGIMVKCR